MKDTNRNGMFSSSNIAALMKNGRGKDSYGVPFYSLVKEKRRERRAGQSMGNDARHTPADWGNMCESIAHEHLPLDYQLVSNDGRLYHELLPWCGVPDGFKDEDTVTDIKCPFTLTSFFNILEAVEGLEPDGIAAALLEACEEYFWQLISNAILSNRSKCELILFMPKKSMIEDIQQVSKDSDLYWFHMKNVNEMPWTADDSDIPVITIIKFDATDELKKQLTDRVEAASELLLA